MNIVIRKAVKKDEDQAWPIIKSVIQDGDSYVYHPESGKDKMLKLWFSHSNSTYVATVKDKVVGTFWIRENQLDLGSHIANAAYMVSPYYRGMGIGRLMADFSIMEAKKMGFKAIQFNLVVKTNARALQLWESLKFERIGEIPEAFQHPTKGMINALIMYRKL